MRFSVFAGSAASYYVSTLYFETFTYETYTLSPFRVKFYAISGILVLTIITIYFLGQCYHRAKRAESQTTKKKVKKKVKKETQEDTQSWGSVINDATQKKKEF